MTPTERNEQAKYKRLEALKEEYKTDLKAAYDLGKSKHADNWPLPKDDFVLMAMIARCKSRLVKNELLKQWLKGKEVYRKENLKQTTNAYWECDCSVFFVHTKTEPMCVVCGADFLGWPSARNQDVVPYNFYANRKNIRSQKAALIAIKEEIKSCSKEEESSVLDLLRVALKELRVACGETSPLLSDISLVEEEVNKWQAT